MKRDLSLAARVGMSVMSVGPTPPDLEESQTEQGTLYFRWPKLQHTRIVLPSQFCRTLTVRRRSRR